MVVGSSPVAVNKRNNYQQQNLKLSPKKKILAIAIIEKMAIALVKMIIITIMTILIMIIKICNHKKI